MASIISASIDLTKIDKAKIYEGKNQAISRGANYCRDDEK